MCKNEMNVDIAIELEARDHLAACFSSTKSNCSKNNRMLELTISLFGATTCLSQVASSWIRRFWQLEVSLHDCLVQCC